MVLNPPHAATGRGGKPWALMDMRRALKDKLVNYKIPQELKVVEELPKNAMGKGLYYQSLVTILRNEKLINREQLIRKT